MFFLFKNKNWEKRYVKVLFVSFSDIEHNTEPALPQNMLGIF